MSKVRKILAILENLAFFVFCMVLILFLVQLFCFTSFKIPSDSMEPVLKDGDRILVNKMIKGARLFNVFAALDNEDVIVHRMPGWGNFKRNDILVFNSIRGVFSHKACHCAFIIRTIFFKNLTKETHSFTPPFQK